MATNLPTPDPQIQTPPAADGTQPNTSPLNTPSGFDSREPFIGKGQVTFATVLLSVLVLCLFLSWRTRDATENFSFLRTNRSSAQGSPNGQGGLGTLVDLHPWQTAQALAPLAVSAEEINYAREAERLADHEVDQAFAAALRQATLRTGKPTGQAVGLSQKVAALQQTVKSDQALVDRLTEAAKSPAKASAPNAPVVSTPGSDLDVAKAQLGLDTDELNDAQRDLARASGDESSRIQQELADHESQMRKYDAQADGNGELAVISEQQYATLLGRIRAWVAQRTRKTLILQAMSQSQNDAAQLIKEHNALESQANAAVASEAASQAAGTSAPPDKADRIATLHELSKQRQILSIYDDRIQTQQQLAAVYSKWSAQVALQHRIVLRLMVQSFALIAFILLGVILIDAAIRRLLSRPTLDRRRTETLRTILEVTVQLVGIVLILLVLFGTPRQTPTILGLATAALTFVMQPFILAFFGWFVLMGRNGIRVGDWVEINGIGGEVSEIGLFRTAILETGNWTDKGHPTGRRATFINNFAISGQYFNFSTTGQWMWDQIKVNIPGAEDTYATIEAIHKAVLKETDHDARLAEQEWKRAARQNNMSQFSAVPAVDMRPAANGIDIIIRYVTRANDRFEVRNRIYQRIIELLQKPPAQLPPQNA